MFDGNSFQTIKFVSERQNINPAALAAIVEVSGITYAKVDGRAVPVIRIEGHYLNRHVPVKKQ